jgi:DNA-binding CsgD family transcriptional regulator
MLIGRGRELSALTQRIDAANQGGGTVLLRGDAGMGKSSLLEAARSHAEARGFGVLATVGVQSESHLPFAGLHHLLLPVLGEAERLPPSQREAVHAAFGLTAEAAPSPFLIALATLHLLCESATRAPVLLLVDDAQWLDDPTADALAFVARRLESDPIVLVPALRDGFESVLLEAGLPELQLEGLADTDAAALLDACEPALTPALRERVLRDAAGNPLALVELPIALRSAGVSETALAPPWLPLTARLERAFAARVSRLPETTRSLLLVAAADEGAVLADVLQAASEVEGTEVTLEAVAEAAAAGLVEVEGLHLRFRHPLMRSAIHEAASPAERQTVHAALAAALVRHPDRRAWHRAAAAVGTDETVAAELDEVAERAQRRGATAVAVAALERAAQLAADPARRGGRLVRSAELALELGWHGDVVRLLGELEHSELGALDRPRLTWLREIEEGSWSGASRVAAFVEIADRMRRGGDSDRALAALLTVALRCWWSNPDRATRDLVVSVAERIPVPEDHPKLVAILALAAPLERGAVVVDRLSRLSVDAGTDPEAIHLLGLAATGVGAFGEAERRLEAAVAGLRAQGRLGLLAQALVSQAWTGIHLGNWRLASLAAGEAGRLAQETAQPLWVTVAQLAEAMIAAYRGDADATELAADGERVLLPIGANPMLSLVQFARGAAGLAEGRHAESYEHLRRIFDPVDLAYHPLVRSWALVDLVEAAAHSDHHQEAGRVVRELEPLVSETRSPLLQAALDFARPMLAADEDAEAQFRASLGPRLADWPFARARLELAYGSWLRRQRRVAESRAPLRAARDAFDALGAAPWGERARQELRASGETSRSRTRESWDVLSPQEMQIAQMAAAGMTNKEIGRQLYLSHRTVGSHLYRIFPKLGITARSQLRGALRGRSGTP